MPTGSCGRFLFGRFATPSARTKPPGRAAQKLVRRPNKRTRQCALESIDLRTAPPASELRAEPSTTSSTRPPHEAGPGCRARRARHTAHGAVSSPSPRRRRRRCRRRQSQAGRGHKQERTRRRRRAASPRSAPAPARSSASAESARYHKKTSNSALDAPAGCRSTSWQRFSSPQDVRRTSGW